MKTIKIKIKKIQKKSKIKDLVLNSTMVKAAFSELRRKIKFINKQRQPTNLLQKTF